MNTLVLKNQKRIVTEKRTKPSPGAGEVVIAVACCGICRTDRKCCRQGQRDLLLPRVLGHEFSGVITAVGEGVDKKRIGERVVVHPGIACMKCDHCLAGKDQCCSEMKILGFHLDGGFSRYCMIPAEGVKNGIIYSVPKNVSLRYAALCEPLGCAVHMIRQMDLKNTESVLIPGGGVLGFLTALLLRNHGVNDIVITEPFERKRKVLKKSGFFSCAPESLGETMKNKKIKAFDAAIPCAPYSVCFAQAVDCLKNSGFFGYFSGLIEDDAISTKVLNQIHYKELIVKGVYGCGMSDTRQALKLMENGFDLSDLPIRIVDLEEAKSILKEKEIENDFVMMIEFNGEGE